MKKLAKILGLIVLTLALSCVLLTACNFFGGAKNDNSPKGDGSVDGGGGNGGNGGNGTTPTGGTKLPAWNYDIHDVYVFGEFIDLFPGEEQALESIGHPTFDPQTGISTAMGLNFRIVKGVTELGKTLSTLEAINGQGWIFANDSLSGCNALTTLVLLDPASDNPLLNNAFFRRVLQRNADFEYSRNCYTLTSVIFADNERNIKSTVPTKFTADYQIIGGALVYVKIADGKLIVPDGVVSLSEKVIKQARDVGTIYYAGSNAMVKESLSKITTVDVLTVVPQGWFFIYLDLIPRGDMTEEEMAEVSAMCGEFTAEVQTYDDVDPFVINLLQLSSSLGLGTGHTMQEFRDNLYELVAYRLAYVPQYIPLIQL